MAIHNFDTEKNNYYIHVILITILVGQIHFREHNNHKNYELELFGFSWTIPQKDP